MTDGFQHMEIKAESGRSAAEPERSAIAHPALRSLAQGEFEAMVRCATSCFIGAADRNANPVFVNDVGLRMVGLQPDADLDAISIIDFVAESDRRKMLDEALPATFRTGSWEGGMRFRRFDRDGTIMMSQRIFSYHDESGQFAGLATIAVDVSSVRRHDCDANAWLKSLPIDGGVGKTLDTDYELIVDVARTAVDFACRQVGDHSKHRRATIGLFALQGARAGILDARKLAVRALANAEADPYILGRPHDA